jgi:hypothetical protein
MVDGTLQSAATELIRRSHIDETGTLTEQAAGFLALFVWIQHTFLLSVHL